MGKDVLNCLSLFSGAGIGETYFKKAGINVLVANELMPKRADLYKSTHPETEVVCGDITNKLTQNEIYKAINKRRIDFILASPPCQGFSVAGKNRRQDEIEADKRNTLFLIVLKFIKHLRPSFVLFENVPSLLKFKLPYKNKNKKIMEILGEELGSKYKIEAKILNASDYGVPQNRERAIIKIYKKGNIWDWPTPLKKKVTVREAIGYLPSLNPGEKSNIKWHFARPHSSDNILWMKHTPTGHSAFENKIYFPQKKDGTRIKGFESSYRRIKWDEPAPTITIRSDCISSQRNVHPGRLLEDGTYSDPRVLTPLELMILDSLPKNWKIPDNTPELLIRQVIGESIPPKMLLAIVKGIHHEQKN